MSQYVEGPTKTFTAAAALAPFLRVYISDATTTPPTVNAAGASAVSIGVVEGRALAAGDPVTIRLTTAQGTRKMVAAGTITAGDPVYAAASGKIASSGTIIEGRAMETSGANNDVIEVLGIQNSDISTSISGTTAAAFAVDSDATTPKIALQGQSGGTGDYTTTLKPEATLSGNNAIIVPESDGDTLMSLALAQTVTGAKTHTGRLHATGNVANTAGVGITGTAASFLTSVQKKGTIIKTEILIDLAGLNSGGTAGDIIGANGAGVAHLGQITAAINGTIVAGKITCLETPAGGDPDIDLWYADEATGVEDTAISALTGETQVINHGDWAGGEEGNLTAVIAADKYLYLTTGDATDATYTAGIMLIELWGKAA